LLQNTLGRSAYLEKIRLDKKLDEAKNSGDSKAVLRVMKDMKSVSKAAGREYNAMNSFAPKTLEKVGLSGKWAMQTTKAGGFAGRTETKAKELSEEFKGSSLGGKNTETIKKNVAEAAHQNSPEFQEKSRLIKEQKKVVEEQLHATKTMRETAEKQLHLGEKEAAGAREQHTEEASTALKKAQGERDEALKSATTTDERKAVIDEHDNKVREIQRDLNTKIAESNKVAENARRELDIASRPVTLAKEALQKTEKEAEKLSSEIKKKAEIQSTKIIQSYNEGIQAAIVKKGGSPYVAKKVEKLWGDKNKQEQLKKRLQALELDDKIGAKQEKPEAH
jgi:hypothetical protein